MAEAIVPKIELQKKENGYASFVVEPLEAGYGVTLGNALRRVLLSSLPGAAITAIRIEGIYHEFSPVPHLREDVTDIILNVKKIRLKSYSDRQVHLQIQAQGEGPVTAADIICPDTIEIVNPDQPIAILDSPDAVLEMELTAEQGQGYHTAEADENAPIGVIPVDAIFSPVRKVNYRVDHTRVGQMTNYDRLNVEIWTDGTIEPDEALSKAGEILVQRFSLFANMTEQPERPITGEVKEKERKRKGIPLEYYDTPIDVLNLSMRGHNCLKRAGISSIGLLMEMSEEELLGVRNFGQKSLTELYEKLLEHGYLASGQRLGEPENKTADMDDGLLEPVASDSAATL